MVAKLTFLYVAFWILILTLGSAYYVFLTPRFQMWIFFATLPAVVFVLVGFKKNLFGK